MLLAGIVGWEGKTQTANLIHSFLSSNGKKVSVIDSGNLAGMSVQLVRNYLNELDRNDTDVLVLKINIADFEDTLLEVLHFDIIIYTDKADESKRGNELKHTELVRRVFSLLDEKGVVIVNVDDAELLKFLQGMQFYTVTYGFNSKASMTTSSLGDIMSRDGFICCLQRSISTKNGSLVEPQEYRISLENGDIDTHNILAAATFAIVNDIDVNGVKM